VKAIMHGQGTPSWALRGYRHKPRGGRRHRAIASPLLEDNSIQGAQAFSSTFPALQPRPFTKSIEASSVIQKAAHENANIIFGAGRTTT